MDPNLSKIDILMDRLMRGETKDAAGNEFDLLKRIGEMFPSLQESEPSEVAAAGDSVDSPGWRLLAKVVDEKTETNVTLTEDKHDQESSQFAVGVDSIPHRRNGISGLGWFAAAAAVVVGVFLGRFFAGKGPHALEGTNCEIILANLTPVPDSRLRGGNTSSPVSTNTGPATDRGSQPGAENERPAVAVTSEGSFAIAPESTYGLVIRSPRAGWATVVVLDSNQPKTYPKPGQPRIPIRAESPFNFRPLVAPMSGTRVLAIVTDSDATEVIDGAVRSVPPESIGSVVFVDRIREALGKTGRSWAAIGQVVLEPAQSPPR